jgi:hypothetical protein
MAMIGNHANQYGGSQVQREPGMALASGMAGER